jgi:multicomponent Na+:H+ antiporter subunit C
MFSITNVEEIVAVTLFAVGFTTLLLHKNLLKKILGFDIMDCATFLFLAAKGYVSGREAPIYVDGITDASHYMNPIPEGLVLTGIVVSVSVSAIMLALTIRLYARYQTLELDQIMMRIRREQLEKDEAWRIRHLTPEQLAQEQAAREEAAGEAAEKAAEKPAEQAPDTNTTEGEKQS